MIEVFVFFLDDVVVRYVTICAFQAVAGGTDGKSVYADLEFFNATDSTVLKAAVSLSTKEALYRCVE